MILVVARERDELDVIPLYELYVLDDDIDEHIPIIVFDEVDGLEVYVKTLEQYQIIMHNILEDELDEMLLERIVLEYDYVDIENDDDGYDKLRLIVEIDEVLDMLRQLEQTLLELDEKIDALELL